MTETDNRPLHGKRCIADASSCSCWRLLRLLWPWLLWLRVCALDVTCRKAHRRMAKALVPTSYGAAVAGCMLEHRHRRILGAQCLEATLTCCTAEPAQLARKMESVLAALAYARDEVLWYFLHINEVGSWHSWLMLTALNHLLGDGRDVSSLQLCHDDQASWCCTWFVDCCYLTAGEETESCGLVCGQELPVSAFKALLGSHHPLREAVTDPSVPRLLAAMHRTVQLLLQYR